jgi:hypothetical protein
MNARVHNENKQFNNMYPEQLKKIKKLENELEKEKKIAAKYLDKIHLYNFFIEKFPVKNQLTINQNLNNSAIQIFPNLWDEANELICTIHKLENKTIREHCKPDPEYFNRVLNYYNKSHYQEKDPRFFKESTINISNSNVIIKYTELIEPIWFNNNEKNVIIILKNILNKILDISKLTLYEHDRILWEKFSVNELICHACYTGSTQSIEYAIKCMQILLDYLPNNIVQIFGEYIYISYNGFKYTKKNKYKSECVLKFQSRGKYTGEYHGDYRGDICNKIYTVSLPFHDIVNVMSLDTKKCKFKFIQVA